jgi:sarcosine oxidase subunit gamma
VAEPLTACSAFGPSSGLGALRASASAAFAAHARSNIALASVIARRNRASALAARVAEAFEVELPQAPLRRASRAIAFVWAGPERWLVERYGEAGHRLEVRLRSALGELAAVSDQSDGHAILRISGARARDVLAKGLPVDTHPGSMQPGSVVLSAVGHIGVHLWQLDEAPTYDCAVARSLARDLLHWVEMASAEFRPTPERP